MPLLPGEKEETQDAFASARSAAIHCPAPSRPKPRRCREIIQEMLLATTSERQGRIIDQDEGGAGMEEKKERGYF